MHIVCLLLLWKRERRKNNCYLVFGDKNIENEEFLISKKINVKHGWPAFAQEAHAPLKEAQNNRRLAE